MVNELLGIEAKTPDEVIDVFSCCGRRVHETPQGIFDDATGKHHEHDLRLPDDLMY